MRGADAGALIWPRFRRGGPPLLFGLFAGGAVVCLIVTIFRALGWFTVGGVQFNPAYLARSGLFLLLDSLAEILLVCSLGFTLLRPRLGTWGAALLASLLFGLTHLWNPHATLGSCLAVAVVVGLPSCALYAFSRSFWAALGFHWTWNFLLGPVLGVIVAGHPRFGMLDSHLAGPDLLTGGLYGPEAGLVAVLLNGLVAAFLLQSAGRRTDAPRTPSAPSYAGLPNWVWSLLGVLGLAGLLLLFWR